MKATRKYKPTYERAKWKPNCSVCQYMKKNKEFRFQIFNSSYFNPEGKSGPMQVVHAYGDPFIEVTLYACLQRHHGKNRIRAAAKVVDGQVVVDSRFKSTVEVVEQIATGSVTNHELGLDDFIQQGRDKLARNELQITATTFLQAIKTKMDNDAKTKDRRADMLQGLFKGAAPKNGWIRGRAGA